nr:hypothetical protein [Streptomyces ruber]
MNEWQIMRGRVYGADHTDPGPRPGRAYAELVGGPLDGLLLDITDRPAREVREGVALRTEIGRYGAGGRALYVPRGDGGRRFDWAGDTP